MAALIVQRSPEKGGGEGGKHPQKLTCVGFVPKISVPKKMDCAGPGTQGLGDISVKGILCEIYDHSSELLLRRGKKCGTVWSVQKK